ncbi:30S ribosomal protein S20 [Candidatus Giovannonibacteria bacterium]|nr:30S ribosomal protein S20 [Candidatus Giovannonibacteria bacterium]
MPILKSAKKALRQATRKRERNLIKKRELEKVLKNFSRLLKAKKIDEAKSAFPKLQKAIDKAAKNRILKRNNAARKKSRLAKALR